MASIQRPRLEMALERLTAERWATFERFASTFLSAEFPELRTTASNAGDRGRDAELFEPADEPSVLLQYSVTPKWDAKIRDTAKRIRAEFPSCAILIYASNQIIGAQGDAIRTEVRRDYQISVDIRDRTWFLERFQADGQRQAAAEGLAHEIVDPLLRSQEIIETQAQVLDNTEQRVAFVFLGLQLADDSQDKGLTKVSFQALVLHHTR